MKRRLGTEKRGLRPSQSPTFISLTECVLLTEKNPCLICGCSSLPFSSANSKLNCLGQISQRIRGWEDDETITKYTIGETSLRRYPFRMDWQQTSALVIVVITAALFLRARLRKRKGKFPCDSGCGCGSSTERPKETVVYHARKGERPEIIVKLN